MIASIRLRDTLLGLCAIALVLPFGSPAPRAENLPIFTSAIDATGTRLQLRGAAPHRDTQQRVDVPLPAELLPPRLNTIFATPLSTQMDQFWNVIPDKKTGMTPRQAICDGPDGIQQQVARLNKKLPDGVRLIVTCNFAPTGQLLLERRGSGLMFVAYQLTNNSVTVRATTPGTCSPGKSVVCPDDPVITVTFAAQIVTVLRTPSLCSISAEDGTAIVRSPTFRGDTTVASIGLDLARLLMPNQAFPMAESAIRSMQKRVPLPLDAAFDDLRSSPACTGKSPGLSRALTAFRELETEVDLRNRAIILRAVHVGIGAPTVSVADPGGPKRPPATPSFTRPEISLSQPVVRAGNPVQVKGQHWPANTNLSTFLPMVIQHGGWGNSSLPVCGGGGGTELQWGPAGRPLSTLRLQPDAQGRCATRHEARNLTPGTTYQFRVRDCDVITCSPWSSTVRGTTARAGATPGRVVLTLDGRTQLGAATTNANGIFTATVTIPAGTPAGRHAIQAVSGTKKTSENFEVTAATAGASRASLMMVAHLQGQTGCPNNPINSAGTDDTFMLFGSGLHPAR